ncbi:hypothetical protein C8F01DRAFT_383693 [Mycena amicta]|nr:hypothetical protein C8F01DRAFT_383693 [Mycena amicta]
MPIEHVLIVGGGLAGPALALALARRNIRSSVYELRSQRYVAGGSITLAPNALRALDHVVGVYDRLKSAGFEYRNFEIHADDGSLLGHLVQGDADYNALRILRSTLHNTLLDACEESDLIDVHYGAETIRVEETAESVTLHFKDGTSARGDLLVGADGIHSKVREHILGDSAPTPAYLGSCFISGNLALASLKLPPGWSFPATLFTPIGIVAIFPHNPSGSEAAWYISEEVPAKDRAGWREYQNSGAAVRSAKTNYGSVKTEPIYSLMNSLQDDTAVYLWSPHALPTLPTWHRGRACIIGDAAHSLAGGQGSAMAFEDAAYLARVLGASTNASIAPERLLAQFERNRRPRIERVIQLGHATAPAKAAQLSPWKYTLKKWAMNAYFLWNNRELRDERISSYDVTQQPVDVE